MKMKSEDIKTLYDLRDYINESEDYPLDVEDICKRNGWKTLDDAYVCVDTLTRDLLVITENGCVDGYVDEDYDMYDFIRDHTV